MIFILDLDSRCSMVSGQRSTGRLKEESYVNLIYLNP